MLRIEKPDLVAIATESGKRYLFTCIFCSLSSTCTSCPILSNTVCKAYACKIPP